MHTSKGFAPILWVIIAAVLLGGGFFAYRNYQPAAQLRQSEVQSGKQPTTDNQQQEKKEDANMKDWKTYRNEEYGFLFQYPVEWTIREITPDPNMFEPWRSFEFYSSYTKPGGQDHHGFVAVSKKSVDELMRLQGHSESWRIVNANGYTYIVTDSEVLPTFRFTR